MKQQEKGVKLQYEDEEKKVDGQSPLLSRKKVPRELQVTFCSETWSTVDNEKGRERKRKRRAREDGTLGKCSTHLDGGTRGRKKNTLRRGRRRRLWWNSTSNDCPVSFPRERERENGREHWEMKQNTRGEKVSPLNFFFRFVDLP